MDSNSRMSGTSRVSLSARRISSAPPPRDINVGIPLNAARQLLQSVAGKNDTLNSSRPRTWKKAVKINFPAVTRAFEVEACSNGLDLQDLKDIWNVLTLSERISQREKTALVACMIPRTKIPGDFIGNMIDWLSMMVISPEHTSKFVSKVLMYIIELVNNGLVLGSPFAGPLYYNSLMKLTKGLTGEAFAAACHLLKLVTTPGVVNPAEIPNFLQHIMRELTPIELHALQELLRIFKAVCPNEFRKNAFKMRIISANRKFTTDITLSKRIWEAECRISGKPRSEEIITSPVKGQQNSTPTDSCNAAKRLLFAEYQPASQLVGYSGIRIANLSKEDKLYHFLLREDCMLLLLRDRDVFFEFQVWLQRVLDRNLNTYSRHDEARYKFIFEKCCFLARTMERGLDVVNDWLPNFFLRWDMMLFRHEILQLLSYSDLLNFEEYPHILDKLEYNFINGSGVERIEIWETLEKLCYRWWAGVEETVGGAMKAELDLAMKIVENLYHFMCKLINIYAASVGFVEHIFLLLACDSFKMLMKAYMGVNSPFTFIPMAPRAFWYLVLTSNSLSVLNSFSELLLLTQGCRGCKDRNFRSVRKLCEEVRSFFRDGAPLRLLYSAEEKERKWNSKPSSNSRNSIHSETTMGSVAEPRAFLRSFTCLTYEPLEQYKIGVASYKTNLCTQLDVVKLGRNAPFIANLIKLILNGPRTD